MVLGPLTPEAVAAIRARHEDFEARYSPGPDWEPFNQTHRDRGRLLAALEAAAARERALAETGWAVIRTLLATVTNGTHGPTIPPTTARMIEEFQALAALRGAGTEAG